MRTVEISGSFCQFTSKGDISWNFSLVLQLGLLNNKTIISEVFLFHKNVSWGPLTNTTTLPES